MPIGGRLPSKLPAPFDMAAYVRERDRAAMHRISAGMDRRPKGLVVEGVGHPHRYITEGFNPHDFFRRPPGRAGRRGR
jgi:hypothetical protein